MRFVIATLPDVKFSLGRDLSLVKACALYGEESILFSPTFAGAAPMIDFVHRPILHQLLWLALIRGTPMFAQGEDLSAEERAARIAKAQEQGEYFFFGKAHEALRLLASAPNANAEKELAVIAQEIEPFAARVATVFSDDKDFMQRARQIAKAEQLGLVRIETIHDTPRLSYDPKKLTADVGTALSRADAYGALDERFLEEFSTLSLGQTQKLRTSQVASTMFDRLPGFSTATIEEIFDLRKELAPYVARFRKGMLEIANTVKVAPWEDDFPHEIERELQIRVSPAIAEIDERVRSNSYMTEILQRAVKNPFMLPASSAFGLLLSSSAQTSTIIGQVASVIAGTGLLAFDAHRAWKDKQREIEGNAFFFYYRAEKLLSPSKKGVEG
jgi:hypothetical protein